MDSSAAKARAALDAARAVFSTMTNTGDTSFSPPSVRGFDASTSTRAGEAWNSSMEVLRVVTGRVELEGQALVSEARRMDFLTLGDAHALIALQSFSEKASDRASVDERSIDERSVAREALLALEHAVATLQRDEARDVARDVARGGISPGASAYMPASAESRQPRKPRLSTEAESHRDSLSRGRAVEGSDPSPGRIEPTVIATAPHPFYQSAGFLIGIAALVVLAVAGGWYIFGRNSGTSFEVASSAYTRGSRETARIAFARLAQENPDDARSFIYLGRIAREGGDLPEAQRFLDRAVRLAPNSALAQREMGSVMLAEGNNELARRFYVRSLEIDGTDRLAQGMLACSLHRLGRVDEAARWSQRAGVGEWSPCLSMPPGTP